MILIWLGALLVFFGVLQMAFQPIWRGRLSGTKRLRSGLDTLEPEAPVAASASNRTGLDLCWSRLAALSCWPQLSSELKRTSLTLFGVALHLAGPSVLEPCRFLAPSSGWGMSAIPPLSGDERTTGMGDQTDADDSSATSRCRTSSRTAN
jgi:hypothetical protein